MSDLQLAAVYGLSAALLAIVLIIDEARREPAPEIPVRLADRTTWRRKPGFWRAHWGVVFGAAGVVIELLVLSPLIAEIL